MRKGVDIVRHEKIGEFFHVQMGIDGTLSHPMQIHASARDQFSRDADWEAYLERAGQTMINLYGDARHPQELIQPEA